MYSSEQDRENTLNVMFNLGTEYNIQTELKSGDETQSLFFPLPFFFNNHYVDSMANTTSFRAPMPLCAMHNSEITLVIKFLPLVDIVSDADDFATDADLTDFMFVTEEVTLTPSERFMLRSTRQEYPIEKVTAEDTEVPALLDSKFRYYFNSAYSCRAIFWALKEAKTGYNPRFFNSIIDARITTINKTDRNELRQPLFLQQLQAYIHDYYNDGSFYAYSFSELPLQVVLGDYEFRAPRPQSAYIDIGLTIASGLYQNWSQTLEAEGIKNFTIEGEKILLDTNVGFQNGDKLLSLDMKTNGYFRTSTAGVGIPATAYESNSDASKPPFYMRFDPWSNVYKITILSTEYFPSTTSHYVDSAGVYQDGSFTYLTANDVNVPYWNNGTTDAVLIHQDGSGAPTWGIYTGDVSLLTAGVSSVTGSFSNIAGSFTLGIDYPTDSGTTATHPHLKITPDSRMNVYKFVPVIEQYILTMYYISTNKFIVENSTVDIFDFDVSTGIVDDRIEIERKAAEARAIAEAVEEKNREIKRLQEEEQKRIENEQLAIQKAKEEQARLEAEEAARLAEEERKRLADIELRASIQQRANRDNERANRDNERANRDNERANKDNERANRDNEKKSNKSRKINF
jgi:hypothetical protein